MRKDARYYGRRLRRVLKEPLKAHGFSEIRFLSYVRGGPDIMETIAFIGRIDRWDKLYKIFRIVGVRYSAIERIYDPKNIDRIGPTVSIPLYELRDPKGFDEWTFHDLDTDEAIRNALMTEIETYAFPFWNDFKDIAFLKQYLESFKPKYLPIGMDGEKHLRQYMESPQPKYHPSLDAQQHFSILAIIEFINSNKARAFEIIDEALEERKYDFPKYRRMLEELRERLKSMENSK